MEKPKKMSKSKTRAKRSSKTARAPRRKLKMPKDAPEIFQRKTADGARSWEPMSAPETPFAERLSLSESLGLVEAEARERARKRSQKEGSQIKPDGTLLWARPGEMLTGIGAGARKDDESERVTGRFVRMHSFTEAVLYNPKRLSDGGEMRVHADTLRRATKEEGGDESVLDRKRRAVAEWMARYSGLGPVELFLSKSWNEPIDLLLSSLIRANVEKTDEPELTPAFARELSGKLFRALLVLDEAPSDLEELEATSGLEAVKQELEAFIAERLRGVIARSFGRLPE